MSTEYGLDLGPTTRKWSDCSPAAQCWLNRAINHLYGFHHEEAIRMCQRALEEQLDLPMALFFIAYCHAPNYNNPDGLDLAEGRARILAAKEALTDKHSHLERDLIDAQCLRYPEERPEDCHSVNVQYAKRMKEINLSYPEEPALIAFYVEALMNLAPWALWQKKEQKIEPESANTLELVSLLEESLAKYPHHPGLCHFYIHVMELGPEPGKALAAADVLRSGVVPDGGHLLHMASHIDLWVGHYAEALDANIKGIAADEKYVRLSGFNNEFYKVYRMHNYHFGVWACMFDGQSAKAMELTDAMDKQLQAVDIEYCEGDLPFGKMYFEAFKSNKYHPMIRFGMWERILAEPLPTDHDLFCGTVTTAYYARGIALAVLGRIEEAEEELGRYLTALDQFDWTGRCMMNNPMLGTEEKPGVFNVATHMLKGELAYRKEEYDVAFEHLRKAVQIEDRFVYDEPWPWMMPSRHALGALLTEQGHLDEAEKVLQEDLVKYPKNLFGLKGMVEVLRKQTGREDDLRLFQEQLTVASERCDIDIHAACFCAKSSCCS